VPPRRVLLSGWGTFGTGKLRLVAVGTMADWSAVGRLVRSVFTGVLLW
jgi:hypothetical protein